MWDCLSRASSEGTGSKPGVPDEEKLILEWEADVVSEYFDKDDNEETKPDPEEIYNSGPTPSLMTPGYISSGLVQNSVSPTPYVPPSKKDYDILICTGYSLKDKNQSQTGQNRTRIWKEREKLRPRVQKD
ncbi:hypothetical protein Tco_0966863 [Tanacetum coccineum]